MKTKQELAEEYFKDQVQEEPTRSYTKYQAIMAFLAGFTACEERDKWISVNDRLPDDTKTGTYLVYGDCTNNGYNSIDIATYGYFNNMKEPRFNKFNQPTHWKHLPKPPEE